MTSKDIKTLPADSKIELTGNASPFISGGEWRFIGVGEDVFTDKQGEAHKFTGLLLESTASKAVFSFKSLSKELVDSEGDIHSALKLGQNGKILTLAKESENIGAFNKSVNELFPNGKIIVVEERVVVAVKGERPYAMRLVGLEKVAD